MAVLQFPGPDRVRPGTLAERAGVSKQAMNQLLQSLETAGYIERSATGEDGPTRMVRFTRRGRAAYSKISDILRDIEREWAAELGPKPFAELKGLLTRVWQSPWPGSRRGSVSRSVVPRHAFRAEAVREVGVRATGNERLEWFPRAGFIPDAFTHRTNRKEAL